MARIIKPYVIPGNQPLPHNRLNDNYQRIYDEFDGNLDDTNVKVGANIDGAKILDASIPGSKLLAQIIADGNIDVTSAKIVRVGPTLPSPNGLRLVTGILDWSMNNPSTSTTMFVVFATDSIEGNPRFFTPPTVVGGLEHTGFLTGTAVNFKLGTRYAAGFFVTMIASAAAPANASGKLFWQAMGEI